MLKLAWAIWFFKLCVCYKPNT